MQRKEKRHVGDIQAKTPQWLMGGAFLAGIVLLLWFPLIIIALPGATTPNHAVDLKIAVRTRQRQT